MSMIHKGKHLTIGMTRADLDQRLMQSHQDSLLGRVAICTLFHPKCKKFKNKLVDFCGIVDADNIKWLSEHLNLHSCNWPRIDRNACHRLSVWIFRPFLHWPDKFEDIHLDRVFVYNFSLKLPWGQRYWIPCSAIMLADNSSCVQASFFKLQVGNGAS